MKRADSVLNQVFSLAINYHKAQTNVEVNCHAAYPLKQPLTNIMSTLRTLICDASDCNLATPSAARLLLYSYVQDVQDNTTQYLKSVGKEYSFVITSINTSSQSTTTSSCRSVWR
ncbi:hypothetical protein Tsp_05921, partial [Trichinella spiralis]|uniref:hypothetical protein n=1 Tax=Trichinella spiralis TaxID=6334 RepID=UPI0001EFC9B4